MALIERRQLNRGEPLPLVKRPSLDPVVVDPDPLVRVTNREIHRQIEAERVVVEVEFSERGVGGVEFHGVRAEDEPEN